MVMKMRAFFKGLKIISQMFVHKEHEIQMEIGQPTDVRHVSHIGLGGADTCPSWMGEFFRGAAAEELSAGRSMTQSRQTSWASLDFEHLAGATLPTEELYAADSSGQDPRGGGPEELRRKRKDRTSPSPSSSSRSRASSFATACDDFSELHGIEDWINSGMS